MQQTNNLIWISILFIVAVAALTAGYLLGMNRPAQLRPLQPSPQASAAPTFMPATPSPEATPIVSPDPNEGVMCTLDAKLCPDGSAVGRGGPNCEFDPCPGEAP